MKSRSVWLESKDLLFEYQIDTVFLENYLLDTLNKGDDITGSGVAGVYDEVAVLIAYLGSTDLKSFQTSLLDKVSGMVSLRIAKDAPSVG